MMVAISAAVGEAVDFSRRTVEGLLSEEDDLRDIVRVLLKEWMICSRPFNPTDYL
jgi:hypothetical protein